MCSSRALRACLRLLSSEAVKVVNEDVHTAMECCNIDVQVSRRNSQSFDKLPIELFLIFQIMFITKLKVNLFHKAAIYVYLTNLSISNQLQTVSRLCAKRNASVFTMIANSSEQLAHQLLRVVYMNLD